MAFGKCGIAPKGAWSRLLASWPVILTLFLVPCSFLSLRNHYKIQLPSLCVGGLGDHRIGDRKGREERRGRWGRHAWCGAAPFPNNKCWEALGGSFPRERGMVELEPQRSFSHSIACIPSLARLLSIAGKLASSRASGRKIQCKMRERTQT